MSTATTTITRQEAEKAVLDNIRASSEIDRLKADKKVKMSEVDQKYSDPMAKQEEALKASEKIVSDYVDQERETLLPGDTKSTKLGAGTVGYRKAAAKVVNAEGTTDEDLLEKLAKGNKTLKECITLKTSIDRKKLLKVAQDLDEPAKGKLGLEIVQEEKFFIK